MQVKTEELIGNQLDWAVAFGEKMMPEFRMGSLYVGSLAYSPSTKPNLGLPIIARAGISLIAIFDCHIEGRQWSYTFEGTEWRATNGPHVQEEAYSFTATGDSGPWQADQLGPTMLVAGLRAYVESKFGDSIMIPDNITNEVQE